MKKIYYFSQYDILRARTNQIGDTRLCEGFAENGCDVELIVPYVYRKDNLKKNQVLDAYSIVTKYRIKFLKTFFRDSSEGKFYLLILIFHHFFIFWSIIWRNRKNLSDVVIMSRDPNLLLLPIKLKKIFKLKKGPYIISWVHEVQLHKKIHLKVYLQADGVVGTNPKVIEDIHEQLQISENKLCYSLNPITETQAQHIIIREEAKKKINYSSEIPLIVYTGKLTSESPEIKHIIEAASMLPQYNFLFTGGRPRVLEYWKKHCEENKINNIMFTGFLLQYSNVFYYQFAADALVSYYSTQEHDVRYNLPNKICEYMLTQSPIVTWNFPALKGTLTDKSAIFVEPENSNSLAEGIKKAIEEKELVKAITEEAFHDVQEITFKKRTRVLLDFFETL